MFENCLYNSLMSFVELRGVSQSYSNKKIVLHDISFSVQKGEIHGLIGRNGAGKTTIIKTIIGALPNYSGDIFIDGENRKKLQRSLISYMPEQSKFPKGMSALSYIAYMGFLTIGNLKESRIKAMELFKEYKIEHLAKKHPNSFSTGEKKKIMVLQTLMGESKVLILDEPTANLDPIANSEFVELLVELKRKGKTIIISSHDLPMIEHIIDSVTIVDQGKILFTGNTTTFKGGHLLTKKFVELTKENQNEKQI